MIAQDLADLFLGERHGLAGQLRPNLAFFSCGILSARGRECRLSQPARLRPAALSLGPDRGEEGGLAHLPLMG